MPTQIQIRGATQATQEGRTLASRELDINTTDKRLAVHDGSTAGGIPHTTYADIQNQEYTYAAATGTNSIAITLAKAPAAYAAGQKFAFKAANNNTGSATLNVNSLGAKTLKKISSGAISTLSADDIVSGGIYEATYDGTDLILSGGVGGSSGWKLLQKVTASATGTLSLSSFGSYSAYRITLTNLRPGTNSVYLLMQFNTDTGSNYQYAFQGMDASSATAYTGNGTAQTSMILTRSTMGSGSTNQLGGEILISAPHDTSRHKTIKSMISYDNEGGNMETVHGGGKWVSTSSITSAEFKWESGNFTAQGSITLEGLA
jgi:hypothetical protein